MRVFFLFVSWWAIQPVWGISADSFIENFKRKAPELSSLACQKAKNHRFVFVTGFLNEALPDYFGDQIEWLRACGLDSSDIFLVRFPSSRSFTENAHELTKFLAQEYNSSKKFLLIGHSKGGPEILLSSLKAPEFYQKAVEAMLFIQGAFGGSHVADYLVGEGKAVFPVIDFMVNQALRAVQRVIQRVENLLGEPINDGLRSLTTRWSRRYWGTTQAENVGAFEFLRPKYLNLRSTKSPLHMNPLLFPAGEYLRLVYGKTNDGSLSLSDQTVPFKAVETVDMNADHWDTTLTTQLSGTSKTQRLRTLLSFILSAN